MAASTTPPTACNSIRVTSSSNRLPLGNPSILGIHWILVDVLNLGLVNPNTAALSKPSRLNAGLFLGVGGTAILRRNISPPFGRKLLMNGLPAASGLPKGLPVASWYGGRLGTPA